MNVERREPIDSYGILDKGMLSTDRLQSIVDVIYKIVLSADARPAPEMARKIKEIIPLFEYVELDIKRVEGALRGAYDSIRRHRTKTEGTAEQREVSK